VYGQRVQRGDRHLRASGIDSHGRAGDVVLLEGGSRSVIALAPGEGVYRLVNLIAIPGEPDGQQRIERLHHGDQIARTQIPIDEPRQGVADAVGRRARSDVIVVEKDGDQAGVGAGGFRSFVEVCADWRLVAVGRAVDLDELDFVDRLRRAVLAQVEVGGLEVVDGATGGVGRNDIDGDDANRRRGA